MIRQTSGRWLVRTGGAHWDVARVVARVRIVSVFAPCVGRDGAGGEVLDNRET